MNADSTTAGGKILIVEDDVGIARTLLVSLKARGYDPKAVQTAARALAVAGEWLPDAVLLDLGLPDVSGLEVLRSLRRWSDVPVIVVSARHDEAGKINALNEGADDYITKPFGIMEFLSRVRAALRRAEPEARPNVYSFREILLDNARHSVTVSGAPVELTYKEYSLLRLLLENTNLVVTLETILQVVWGTDISVESRTVDMHIRTLRKKLGDAGKYICTVRKVGYKLTDSEEELEQ